MTWLDELDRRTLAAADNGQYDNDEPVWAEDDPVFLQWPDFWTREHQDHQWLYEPILALGRGHAIYAGHKQGKSLFVLWACTQMVARGDTDIIYLDFEMTEDDLYERLEDMGHSAASNFEHFHYALLPSLPPLDTGEGAGALLALCDTVQHPDRHLAVIIDTTSRAAQGDENSADTYRNFYRWTGISLKRRGITFARLDHAGKDALKGQRGSSGKGDDVDIIWRLIQADGGIKLHRDASRMSWIDETVEYAMTDDPLGFTRGGDLWPAGTHDLATELDRLGVPLDASYNQAREAGIKKQKTKLLKALTFRRQEAQRLTVLDPVDNPRNTPGTTPGTTPIGNLRNQSGNHPTKPPLTSSSPTGNQPEPESRGEGDWVPLPREEPVPPVPTYDPTPEPYELTHTCLHCNQPATDISGRCPTCLNPGQLGPLEPEELF